MRDEGHDGSYAGNWQEGEYCPAVRSEGARSEGARSECVRVRGVRVRGVRV